MPITTPQRLKHTTLMCILLIAMAVVGCTNRAERAAEYNDSIIGYQKQIIAAFDMMDSTFRDTAATKDLVDFAYANLQSKVKLGKLALDSVGSFQKDPSMQLAAKELFKQYEDLVEKEYKTLVTIKLTPAEMVDQALSDTSNSVQTRIYSLSKVSQDKFLRIQKEFGKKYHLEFE
jgi:hypothetical protein